MLKSNAGCSSSYPYVLHLESQIWSTLLLFGYSTRVYRSSQLNLPCFSRTIHYYAELGKRAVFPTCEVPEHFVGQVTVLKYFSHYMEENLMDVSTQPSCHYSAPYSIISFFESLFSVPFYSVENPSPQLAYIVLLICGCVSVIASQGGDLLSTTDMHMPRLYLLQWLKSDRALMMLFNDGTFQVNTKRDRNPPSRPGMLGVVDLNRRKKA